MGFVAVDRQRRPSNLFENNKYTKRAKTHRSFTSIAKLSHTLDKGVLGYTWHAAARLYSGMRQSSRVARGRSP